MSAKEELSVVNRVMEQFGIKDGRRDKCGKAGCQSNAVIEAYKGSLKVKSCMEHAHEVEDVLGNRILAIGEAR